MEPLTFLFGFALGLAIHAALWLRIERIHDADLRREYHDGRKLGYNQCHGEMVAPMQHYIERTTGRKIDWTPLKQPTPHRANNQGRTTKNEEPVPVMSAAH